MKVGSGKILAKIAIAVGIERRKMFAVFGVFDIDATMGGVESTVTSLASRGDAVKSITAILCANEEVARFRAHAE